MECEHVKGMMDKFLQGELSPQTSAEIRLHISRCSSCRAALLRRRRFYREKTSSKAPLPEDWLGRLERRLPREGLWGELTQGLLLPWEKKVPILVASLTLLIAVPLVLHQVGCKQKTSGDERAVSSESSGEEEPSVKLKKSSHGSVLILDEGSEKGSPPSPNEDVAGSDRKLPDYRPFQDQHVKLFVADVPSALEAVIELARSSGGQIIDYPIKGFENMGPHERTLVFDTRTYRPFLGKLEPLGRVDHPPLIRSDYVTVRLTILPAGGDAPE